MAPARAHDGLTVPGGLRGTVSDCGHDMSTNRIKGAARLGYLPENGPLYPDMTPRGLLSFFAEARGCRGAEKRDRIDEVVQLCALKSVIGKPIGKLSRGYRQRVGMAQVLLHQPDVLILDEPTAGLDPNQIHDVRETIRKLGESKTVLLSTHILQEVEAMADRVLFINEGGSTIRSGPGHPAARRPLSRVDRSGRLSPQRAGGADCGQSARGAAPRAFADWFSPNLSPFERPKSGENL